MKIYYPKNQYTKNNRTHLFPLLKPFIKGDSFTDLERIKMYGVSKNDFSFVDVMQDADVVILPMSWNYYQIKKNIPEAIQLIQTAKKYNLNVWSFTNGDFGATIPKLDNLIVLRANGRKNKLPNYHKGLPVFIRDPLQKYFNSSNVLVIPYTKRPIIGFCGQANASIFTACKSILIALVKNGLHVIQQKHQDARPLIATSYLRAKILNKIKTAKSLQDNFILHKQYRAGVNKTKDTHQTTLEFYNNIKDSQYVVCVRGAGNFSVRFYETLAMGRIPIFINTNCILPLAEIIKWKQHMVWVEQNEIHKIEEKVIAFHEQLNSEKLQTLFLANRKLWENKLQLGSYFKTIITNY